MNNENSTMSDEDLISFIKANKQAMNMPEMATATGEGYQRIYRCCKKLFPPRKRESMEMEAAKRFISQNAPYMTLKEMSDETGHSKKRIGDCCKELQITAITIKERNLAYIEQMVGKIPKEKICRALTISLGTLENLSCELGLVFADFVVPEKGPMKTPGQILSEYRFRWAHHHIEPTKAEADWRGAYTARAEGRYNPDEGVK